MTDLDELIAELREVAGVNPLDVTCGECGSKPGKRCYGNGEMRRTHSSRASKAEHELRAAAADALEAATRVPVQGEREVTGNTSDGHHTFDELYEYRMLYNAHAAHGWLAAGIPVVKSWKHSDGEPCFGGGWFIVTATLPAGQVSNHYKAEHWGLFKVPEVELPPAYDGHTPKAAADRLRIEAEHARAVQGEPNDAVKAVIDRDVAIDAIAGGTISVPGGYGVLHGDDAANIVDAIIGHATVPDAATEELARIKPLFENLSREYPSECNKRVKAEAERDAALAAIERGRNVLELLRNYAEDSIGTTHGMLSASFVKEHVEIALAALDEAPEPAWEYGVKWHDSQDPVWYHPYTVEEAENKIAYWPKDPGYVVRRRKAGPWEPVGGEG